eukprot:TRINITY_DN13949_c0_g1_i1.p1 TRINITY_DN13949_c0_g1~~TRINITY_DN13949_c0_g1_i1.p1  ORF type:complete len:248 (+),score=64.85 TRINITY_DN13949_c0_g1_i1:80-823(+)
MDRALGARSCETTNRKATKRSREEDGEKTKKWLPNHEEEEEEFVVQPSTHSTTSKQPRTKTCKNVNSNVTLRNADAQKKKQTTPKKQTTKRKKEKEIQIVIRPAKKTALKKKRKETKAKKTTQTKDAKRTKKRKETDTVRRTVVQEAVTMFPLDSGIPSSALPILISSKDEQSSTANSTALSEITITLPTTLKTSLFKSFSSTLAKIKEQQRLVDSRLLTGSTSSTASSNSALIRTTALPDDALLYS